MQTRTYQALGILSGILLVAALVTWIVTGGPGNQEQEKSAFDSLQSTEDGAYSDLDGNPVDLSQYSGAPVIINSWASWDPFSATMLPALDRLAREYQVSVIAMNRSEPAPKVKAFLEYIGRPTLLVFLLDPNDRFYKSRGGYAMPETIFYDSRGNVVQHKRGVLTYEELVRNTEAMLADQQE